jgi:hypothetical protein
MRGFKMAAGVGGAAAGRNTYGYFGFFQDAVAAMKLAFDPRSTATIHAGLLVGRNEPDANPPKVR